ncbi:Transposon Tf2-11 polyprotein, partial [Orchesella cincta]
MSKLSPFRATATNSINALLKYIIYRHGTPKTILADHGSHLPPPIPQCEWLCEKNNDTIKRTLAKLLHDHGGDWEAQLHPAVFAHNTSIHSVTKHSPFFLVHGREARLSCDNTFPTYPIIETPEGPITRSKAAELANSSAKDNTIKFQAHQSQKYNDTHPTTSFSPGDLVLHSRLESTPEKTYDPYRRQQDKIIAANARLLKKYIPPDTSVSLPSQPDPEPNSIVITHTSVPESQSHFQTTNPNHTSISPLSFRDLMSLEFSTAEQATWKKSRSL